MPRTADATASVLVKNYILYMNISDKAIGYVSFVAILLIIVGVTIGMWNAHKGSSTQAIIDFNELGSLSPEDPMTENGYTIGHVASIDWLGDRSRVSVVFDQPMTLHEGTRFRNAAFALMGQRRIEIIRSHNGEVLSKNHVFTGEFVPGITESLRFITEIHKQSMVVRDAILSILAGNDTTPSVIQKYKESMQNVENMLNQFDKITTTANSKIQDILTQAEVASQAIDQTTDAADSTIQAITAKADSAFETAQNALQGLSQGIDQIDAITRSVQEDSTTRNLLETTEAIEKVNALTRKLEQLIQAINTKGLAMYDEQGNRIKLIRWKNLNIIGATAREKAKEKQKKSANTP